MSMPRVVKRDQFLQTHSLEPTQLVFLASDMSLRQYYRLNAPKRVLMDAPAPENPQQFIQVAKYLQHCGLRAPSILEHCLENGFVLLEDFGDHTFTAILKQSPAREKELYQTSITVLRHLHQHAIERPNFIPLYSIEKLLIETEVFIDWYWKAVTGEEPKSDIKEEFQNSWKKAFENCPATPQSLVLRDFHVDNLMIVDEQDGIKGCGLLDFQDALWGSVVYDVVSLLEDARRDITPAIVEQMWKYFLAELPLSEHQSYKTAATILGAARHTKIIGVFTRYAMRQGKKDYLCHLPRLWKYLEKSLAIPQLKGVKGWFDNHLPIHQQNIPAL
ncbi:MAG: aminoglycoside phosphotransferase [Alphaproteobacteria bacterium]|nr:aminoglycoside phosphotransferase [Alphaproteobacteria bacterium]